MKRIGGLIAATFTPMHHDGSLHLERIKPMVDQLIADGVQGLYVCGSTGEGPSLTTDERCVVAEAFVEAVGGRIPVIVQVGHTSVEDARRMAAHAQAVGADAISAVAPYYYGLTSMDVLVSILAAIAGAAPELPFYYYHVPELTGIHIDMVDLLRRAGDRIPTFAGAKYTAPTIDELQACIALEGGRFTLLFGRDEMLMSGLAVGAAGAVGSTYNFAAPLYRRIVDAMEAGDLDTAKTAQALSVLMVNTLKPFRIQAALKAVMGFIGHDCGPTRLPLQPLSREQTARLQIELERIGFFAWARGGALPATVGGETVVTE